jgi:hypothetical protein
VDKFAIWRKEMLLNFTLTKKVFFMQSTRDNWLARWKRHYNDLSSDFAPRKYYSRRAVDFTHMILLQFWGADFFEFDFIELFKKNQLHFIQSLVFRPNDASFYRLVEACFIIDYAHTYSPEQYQRLESFKWQSEKVRDILCELLIEYAFREAGLKYDASPKRGNQLLEGYCELNSERFLVECKNKYSMNKDEFKVICFLTARLLEIGRKFTTANLGVGYVFFKDKKLTENQTHHLIGELERYLLKSQSGKLDGTFEDEYMRIELKPGTPDNYKEFDNGTIPSNLYFSMKHTYQFDQNDNLVFNMHVGHRSSAKKDELSRRLIRTIDDARKQHKDDPSKVRVFCIFNEFLNDFRPPLLINSADFVPDVSKYLGTKKTDDIVILIDRGFNLETAFIQPHVMGHDHLIEYKKALSKVDFSIRSRIADMAR